MSGTVVSTETRRRQVAFEMFNDLTTSKWSYEERDQSSVFTFDDVLTVTTVTAIRERIESRDDADLEARADLASLATECDSWLTAHPADISASALTMRAVLALYRYTLNMNQEP